LNTGGTHPGKTHDVKPGGKRGLGWQTQVLHKGDEKEGEKIRYDRSRRASR